jgi:hypothetical protein
VTEQRLRRERGPAGMRRTMPRTRHQWTGRCQRGWHVEPMARRVRVTSLELSEESYGDCASGRGQKEDPPRRDAQPGGHTCDDECGEDSENEDHPSHFHSMIAIRCHSKPAMSRITGLAATVSPSLRTGPGRHQTFLSRFRQNATTTHRHKQSELLGRRRRSRRALVDELHFDAL